MALNINMLVSLIKLLPLLVHPPNEPVRGQGLSVVAPAAVYSTRGGGIRGGAVGGERQMIRDGVSTMPSYANSHTARKKRK